MMDDPSTGAVESAPAKKKRLVSVDVLKGLLMIGVCCLHIGNEAMPWTSRLYVLVGIFFMMAGYFYRPGNGYRNNVLKRTRQILIPFLVYGATGLIVLYTFLEIRGEGVTVAHLLDAYCRHVLDNWCLEEIGAHTTDGTIALYVLPMWFLIRLYVSELIMFAIADWALESWKRMVASVALLTTVTFLWGTFVGIHLPFQLNTCSAIASILLIGAYAKKHNIVDRIENGWRKPSYWCIAAALVMVFAAMVMIDVNESRIVKGFFGTIHDTAHMWNVYPWVVEVSAITYLMLVASTFIGRIPVVVDILTKVGVHTLMILSTHQVIAYIILTTMGIQLSLPKGSTDADVIVRIAVIIVCIVAGILLDTMRGGIKSRFATCNSSRRGGSV